MGKWDSRRQGVGWMKQIYWGRYAQTGEGGEVCGKVGQHGLIGLWVREDTWCMYVVLKKKKKIGLGENKSKHSENHQYWNVSFKLGIFFFLRQTCIITYNKIIQDWVQPNMSLTLR